MSQIAPVGLTATDGIIHALTHSGNFHADETLGYVILHYALASTGDLRGRILGEAEPDRLVFERTRDPERIAQADLVFDVGAVHEPARGRYDHHMKVKPLRACGTPYSAAGLLWQDYGRAAIQNIVGEPVDHAALEAIWTGVDKALILPVDQDDNGVQKMGRLSLADLVSSCGPAWDAAQRSGEEAALRLEFEGFATAAGIVSVHLCNIVDRLRAGLKATAYVLDSFARAEDKRILLMEIGMPTEKVIFEHDLPVVYVVSPAGAQWNVKAIAAVRGEFGERVPLPEAWGGLDRAALAEVSGVPDAVFSHPARFICGAVSQEGALTMARRALEIAAAGG